MVTRRGSLLIITLWLVAILGALAVAVARQLSSEIRLTRYQLARAQGQALARSGIYLAMQRLREDTTEDDWAGDTWALPWTVVLPSGDSLTLTIEDEERKLNVNMASHEALARLTDSAEVATAIVAYRDAPDPGEDRPADLPPYYAKNGPIESLEELADLPEMVEEIAVTLAKFTTPYTGQTGTPEPLLNLNTVSADVLRALEVSEGAITAIQGFREGTDGAEAHDLDGVFGQATPLVDTLRHELGLEEVDITRLTGMATSARHFLIISEALVDDLSVRVRVTAVVTRAESSGPLPRILAWREG